MLDRLHIFHLSFGFRRHQLALHGDVDALLGQFLEVDTLVRLRQAHRVTDIALLDFGTFGDHPAQIIEQLHGFVDLLTLAADVQTAAFLRDHHVHFTFDQTQIFVVAAAEDLKLAVTVKLKSSFHKWDRGVANYWTGILRLVPGCRTSGFEITSRLAS